MATSEGIPSSIDIEFLELNDNPYRKRHSAEQQTGKDLHTDANERRGRDNRCTAPRKWSECQTDSIDGRIAFLEHRRGEIFCEMYRPDAENHTVSYHYRGYLGGSEIEDLTKIQHEQQSALSEKMHHDV